MQRAAIETDAWVIRILKLFPWEASSCFTFATVMITEPDLYWLIGAVFALMLLSAWIYYIGVLETTRRQNLIMSGAFIMWALMIAKSQINTVLFRNGYELSATFFDSNAPYVLVAAYVAGTALIFPNEIRLIQKLLGHGT